jgi:hypothetical protein
LAKFSDKIDFNKPNVCFFSLQKLLLSEMSSLILEVMKNRFAWPKDSPHFICLSTVYTSNVFSDFAKRLIYICKVCRQNRLLQAQCLFLFFLEVIMIRTVSLTLEVTKNRFACPKESPHFTCLSTVYTGDISCNFTKMLNYIGKVFRQNRLQQAQCFVSFLS